MKYTNKKEEDKNQNISYTHSQKIHRHSILFPLLLLLSNKQQYYYLLKVANLAIFLYI